jgi:alpha-glucosidase (family GH31 glycosyl hydrolase)
MGDNTADWTFLDDSIADVLSFVVCGIVYTGRDFGVFRDN